MHKYIIAITAFLFVTIRCSSPSCQLKGVVQDGLNGSLLIGVNVTLKGTSNSVLTDTEGNFLLLVYNNDSSIAEKNGCQQLEYKISSRTTGLVLNIIPEPVSFDANDYSSNFIPHTTHLTEEV